jgi:hypothetical protein
MTSCDLAHIRISDPAELIDALPYLLGFHPHESLVLIGFAGTAVSAGPQQVQVTVRLDLPARLPDGFDDEALGPLGDVLRRAGCRSVAAVLVTDSVVGDPRGAGGLLACRDPLAAAMAAAGIEVLDVLAATDRRWWSLCCEQPGCCPSEGNQRLPGSSVAATQAVVAGLVALPDRQALVATLAGGGAEQRSALLPLLAGTERRRAALRPGQLAGWRRAQVAGLFAAVERAPVQPDDEQLAGHAVALTDPAVRDALWLAIDDGSAAAARSMGEWHGRLPAPYDAAPLFLYGWSLWRAGNATLAAMAADRALQSRPGYSAAVLLATAAQRGLDPRTVPVLSQGRRG